MELLHFEADRMFLKAYIVTVAFILSPVWAQTNQPPLLLEKVNNLTLPSLDVDVNQTESNEPKVIPIYQPVPENFPQVNESSGLRYPQGGKEESRSHSRNDLIEYLQKYYGVQTIRRSNSSGIIFVFLPSTSNSTGNKKDGGNLTTLSYEEARDMFDNGCKVTDVEETGENGTVNGVSVKCNNVSIPEIGPFIPNNTLHFEVHNCSHGVNYKLSRSSLSHLTQLQTLRFISCNTRYLTSGFFTGLNNLREVTITRNKVMRVLLRNTFTHVENLEKVEFSYCTNLSMSYVFLAVSTLKHLRILIVEGLRQYANQYNAIGKKELSNLADSKLEELTLTVNNIRIVEAGAFRYLDKLRVLDLSDNPLSEIEVERIMKDLQDSPIEILTLKKLEFRDSARLKKALYPLSNISTLQIMDLRYNSLFLMGKDEFPDLPQLLYLLIDYCGTHMIYANALRSLPNLVFLSLSGNWLEFFNPNEHGLTKLKYLYLRDMRRVSNDSYFSLVPYGFTNWTSLEKLSLSNTRLHGVISGSMFHGLENLKTLELYNCDIRVIEKNAFSSLRSLKQLILSGNWISILDPGIFFGLSKLEHLILYDNFITLKQEKQPFKYLTSLKILMLQHNDIVRLDPETFAHLKELVVLQLDSNNISSWRKAVFSDNPKLKVLSLSYNAIEDITEAMIKDFDQLIGLNLVFNPLNCLSCEMKQFQEWIQSETNNVTLTAKDDISLGAYLCKTPKKFENVYFLDARIPDNYCDEISSVLPIVIAINSASLSVLIILVGMLCYLRWYIRYAWFLIKVGTKRFREEVIENDYVYDAFVSYSPDDQKWVREKLLPAMENFNDGGLNLCVHERDFEAGKLVTDNILESIDKSRKTILILSDSFVTNQWCILEMQLAEHKLFDERKDSLILVCLSELDNKKLTKHLKYLIKTRTFIPWTTNRVGEKLFWERLKFSVQKPSNRCKLPQIT